MAFVVFPRVKRSPLVQILPVLCWVVDPCEDLFRLFIADDAVLLFASN
jgi:hypothetical protein